MIAKDIDNPCETMKLKKYLPTREQLRQSRSLQFLGEMIFEPNLWHFNRYSLSMAVLVGGICCFLPIPFQTIPCALICIWVRCNIPVAMLVVWISNPLTMGPMMYFSYKLGLTMLGHEDQLSMVDPNIEWFAEQIGLIWQPLLLGSLSAGLAAGITGFVAVQLYYRWRIARYKQRKKSRQTGKITRI